ncbi:tail protein X [Sulfitobacter sp. OXR-159]|uniref:tail protein X n=1 Tax=Sulfitobacter sp. OXR-159 TaxID=3100174 RepID=UPI002AC9B5D5|nr:tail protein X [Sulfitobacter sp. OXR-159]WPZ28987.1 tail protein X [Sulfitobacter sp. OXR-159]
MAGSDPYYQSKEGDTVDLIVWKHYGRQSDGLVEAVLAANRGLAALGPILPLGTKVVLPPAEEPRAQEAVRLWG